MSTRRGARNVPPEPAVDPFVWRCQRALARIDRQVDAIVAEHASSYWRRGAARHEDWPSVGWTIDNEVVLELRVAERGPAELVVHDFSLVDPIRRALRTRHVNIRYATFRDVRS